MYYEREIDKIYEKMNNKKKQQLIDAINSTLNNEWHPTHLNINITDEKLKEFLNEYVRTDNEVFDGMVEYLELPYNFNTNLLDWNAVIESDNDYDWLMENLHLNTFLIYECEFDDLIEEKVLIEYKK